METTAKRHDIHQGVFHAHAGHQSACEQVIHFGVHRQPVHRSDPAADSGQCRQRVRSATVIDPGAEIAHARRSEGDGALVINGKISAEGAAPGIRCHGRRNVACLERSPESLGEIHRHARTCEEVAGCETARHLPLRGGDVIRLVGEEAAFDAQRHAVAYPGKRFAAEYGTAGALRCPHPIEALDVQRGRIFRLGHATHRECAGVGRDQQGRYSLRKRGLRGQHHDQENRYLFHRTFRVKPFLAEQM